MILPVKNCPQKPARGARYLKMSVAAAEIYGMVCEYYFVKSSTKKFIILSIISI